MIRAGQMAVRIVGADEGRMLNREYRGRDYATNVLTFDYARDPMVIADLVLCAPIVAAEARRMSERWSGYADAGQSFDLSAEMMRVTHSPQMPSSQE